MASTEGTPRRSRQITKLIRVDAQLTGVADDWLDVDWTPELTTTAHELLDDIVDNVRRMRDAMPKRQRTS